MRVAAVTGSTRGIGRAIGKALEEKGWLVYFSGTSPRTDIAAHYVQCDISQEADRQNFLETILFECGRIDLLVNNAGVAPEKRLDILETTTESFERLMHVNLEGTFFMCQCFANQMIKQGGAGCRIVSPATPAA